MWGRLLWSRDVVPSILLGAKLWWLQGNTWVKFANDFRNLVAKADVLTEVFFFPICGDGWFGADDVVPSILLGCCALVVGKGRSIAQLAWPRQLQPF